MNDCSDLLYPPNLIFEPSCTQIISSATGSDFDSSWQLPEIQAQVKEIGVHETEIFKVILRKNGQRMTITPAVLQNMKEARDIKLERVRQANLLREGGTLPYTGRYTCPFKMARYNGKSAQCARCKLHFGEWVTRPKWPTCPFGTATCKSRAKCTCSQKHLRIFHHPLTLSGAELIALARADAHYGAR